MKLIFIVSPKDRIWNFSRVFGFSLKRGMMTVLFIHSGTKIPLHVRTLAWISGSECGSRVTMSVPGASWGRHQAVESTSPFWEKQWWWDVSTMMMRCLSIPRIFHPDVSERDPHILAATDPGSRYYWLITPWSGAINTQFNVNTLAYFANFFQVKF